MVKRSEHTAQTQRSVSAIADVLKEEAHAKRFMGLMRRAVARVEAFAPTPDDDPYAAARPPADFRIGYTTYKNVTNSMGMSKDFGWVIIFEVNDSGAQRSVRASIEGNAQVGEAEKFFQLCAKRL